MLPDFLLSLPDPLMVCDAEGIITYLNPAAEDLMAQHGGRALLGTNLYDCHPPAAQEKIRSLIREGRSNTYTVEKDGVRRLIHQTPLIRNGECTGLLEISFAVPADLPNFPRG